MNKLTKVADIAKVYTVHPLVGSVLKQLTVDTNEPNCYTDNYDMNLGMILMSDGSIKIDDATDDDMVEISCFIAASNIICYEHVVDAK